LLPIRNQTKAATGEHGSEQKILFKRQKNWSAAIADWDGK